MRTYFVTGISTDVGKTIVSSVLVEALKADYWKPIQAGDLEFSDTDKVRSLVSNKRSVFHSNAYALKTPMSPHAASEIDGVNIVLDEIRKPETTNNLVIEGAGGLLVPLNDKNTIMDLIPQDSIVVLVVKHYLGSINHTLMSINILRQRGFEPVIIYNGTAHKPSEDIIAKMTNVKILARIKDEFVVNKEIVLDYSEKIIIF